MSKPILKSRLLLTGNKLLGSLIYYKDKEGRPCLKFSFKSKIGKSTVWQEHKAKKEKTVLKEEEDNEVSTDVSFKFNDKLLEIKREIPGQKPFREFVPVEVPVRAFLFMVRLKNWDKLAEVEPDANSLLIATPDASGSLNIIFSFLGENGLPFMSKEHMSSHGRTVAADLPLDSPFNKICIGVVQDPNNQEEYDLIVMVPTDY